jgi:hypothetical protein
VKFRGALGQERGDAFCEIPGPGQFQERFLFGFQLGR